MGLKCKICMDSPYFLLTPSDYVLTLDNIIAANPENGEFKLQNTDRIDSKAFPIPTQNIIMFYSNGEQLFFCQTK